MTQPAATSRDPETGEVAEAPRLDPRAVLERILEVADTDQAAQAATTQAAESAAETRAVRTPAELFTDAAARVSTARTATWLDALTDDGTLTAAQRTQLAAEDGAATLGRVLRRAELAGHDPRQVLATAVTERPLDGAHTLANVLHTRITDRLSLDPAGTSYREWLPATDDPSFRERQAYARQAAAPARGAAYWPTAADGRASAVQGRAALAR